MAIHRRFRRIPHEKRRILLLCFVLMMLGVIVGEGFTLTSLKMLIIICILWLTSPVSGHLIGRLEITINDELEKDMMVLDQSMVQHEKEGD